MKSWTRSKLAATDSTRLFLELLSDPEVDDTRLTAGYLETKSVLASAFEQFALERLKHTDALTLVIDEVEQSIQELYPFLSPKHAAVKGFGLSHFRLFAYLLEREGTAVRVVELRILTCDAVHTERRVRELRSLGLIVEASRVGGEDAYVLKSRRPNRVEGARNIVEKNIRDDSSLADVERVNLKKKISCGKD